DFFRTRERAQLIQTTAIGYIGTYRSSSLPVPQVRGHSTRSVCTSWAALRGVPPFQISVQLHHGLHPAHLRGFIGLTWSLITQWQQLFFLLPYSGSKVRFPRDFVGISQSPQDFTGVFCDSCGLKFLILRELFQ